MERLGRVVIGSAVTDGHGWFWKGHSGPVRFGCSGSDRHRKILTDWEGIGNLRLSRFGRASCNEFG
jgi:hypothetical protein